VSVSIKVLCRVHPGGDAEIHRRINENQDFLGHGECPQGVNSVEFVPLATFPLSPRELTLDGTCENRRFGPLADIASFIRSPRSAVESSVAGTVRPSRID
jgi:hypothetical protein